MLSLSASLLFACAEPAAPTIEHPTRSGHEDPAADSSAPDGEPDEERGEERDDAVVMSWQPPSQLDCGETGLATLVLQNTGTTTWTREGGYKLGAVNDEDPFYSLDTRVWMDEGERVEPGDRWVVEIPLTAPDGDGTYTTDWQMVREYVAWFGEDVGSPVEVSCEPEPTGGWVSEACARNGSEICDDEAFRVPVGARMGLLCQEAEGGISFISANTGPEQSDGNHRCQGWEDRGQDAWDYLDYVAKTVCSSEGKVVEVDLSAYEGQDLWFGSHDHPDGGGHMTSTCLVRWSD